MRLSPPPRGFKGMFSWFQEVYQALRSLEQDRAPETLLSKRTWGNARRAMLDPGKGGASDLQFKGEWAAGIYAQGDIVIRGGGPPGTLSDTRPTLDCGRVAGTYIANADVTAEDAPPGTTPTDATATATVSGGHVTALNLTDIGGGYVTTPTIGFSGGGGSGASAIAVVNYDGSISVFLTSGGTGYTSPPTVTIDPAPTGGQKWDFFARGKWPKLTLAPDADARAKQIIVFDSGRDSDLPTIKINKDKDSDTPGSIQLDLNALVAVVGAGDYVMKPYEWDVCVLVAGVPTSKKAIFISTTPY